MLVRSTDLFNLHSFHQISMQMGAAGTYMELGSRGKPGCICLDTLCYMDKIHRCATESMSLARIAARLGMRKLESPPMTASLNADKIEEGADV